MATFIQGDGEPLTQPSPNYPQEIQSVGDKTKNLFDIGKVEEYQTLVTSLLIEDNKLMGKVQDTQASSHCFKLTNYPSGEYSFRLDKESSQSVRLLIRCYDETGTLLNNSNVSISQFTYNAYYKAWYSDAYTLSTTIPSNVAYWQIGFVFIGGSSYVGQYRTASNIQIEKGLMATDYEPYGYKIPVVVNDKTTNIYLKETLRKIGNYIDYLDYKNKKVVKRVKEIVLNGTEGWSSINYGASMYYAFKLGELNDYVGNLCLCTHYEQKTISGSTTHIGINVINSASANMCRLAIRPDINTYTDVAGFKEYLAREYANGTPIIVYCVSTEEIEETIDIPEIATQKGTNIFSIDTKLEPSGIRINYWKQIGVAEVTEEIVQSGTNLLIVSTGAEITQSENNLVIGG